MCNIPPPYGVNPKLPPRFLYYLEELPSRGIFPWFSFFWFSCIVCSLCLFVISLDLQIAALCKNEPPEERGGMEILPSQLRFSRVRKLSTNTLQNKNETPPCCPSLSLAGRCNLCQELLGKPSSSRSFLFASPPLKLQQNEFHHQFALATAPQQRARLTAHEAHGVFTVDQRPQILHFACNSTRNQDL